jgi:hypothetical protein
MHGGRLHAERWRVNHGQVVSGLVLRFGVGLLWGDGVRNGMEKEAR